MRVENEFRANVMGGRQSEEMRFMKESSHKLRIKGRHSEKKIKRNFKKMKFTTLFSRVSEGD